MTQLTRREFIAGGTLLTLSNTDLSTYASAAPPPWNLLSSACSLDRLAAILLPRDKWRPYPSAEQRAPWEDLPTEDRKRLIEAGERWLKTEWPALPASLFMEYARIGNRSNYEGVRSRRRERLRELVIAECVEGRARFVDDIVNGIWTTCEESYWGVPAHLNLQKAGPGLPDVAEPTVDLFTGETSSQLAWTLYLIGPQLDKVSPLIRERIHQEIDRRVLTPNITRNFGWMGFSERPGIPARAPNNWNPWICSNWLASTLLAERDPQRRIASVHKALLALDNFINGYSDDGGCDEGPGYWGRAGGSLFDCLELIYSATNGELDVYKAPLVQEIGRYIYRAHIHDNYFTNFADAPAIVRVSGDLLYRYGARIRDANLSGLGAFAARRNREYGNSDSIGRQIPAIFNLSELRAARGSQPLLRDVWLPGIQVMAARQKQGSPDGLYLAAQGGHNAESHNHNDVGNFIVYADGLPVIIDVGVETYSAKTFSSRRYEIWTMQSAYHNLPTINGVMQKEGRQFEAGKVTYRATDQGAELSMDISTAYPAEASLRSWVRTFRLDRAHNQIELNDQCALKNPGAQISWTFMTPCTTQQTGSGEILFSGKELTAGRVLLLFDGKVLTPSVEEIPLTDGRLRSSWGEKLFRILLRAQHPGLEATFQFRIVQK